MNQSGRVLLVRVYRRHNFNDQQQQQKEATKGRWRDKIIGLMVFVGG